MNSGYSGTSRQMVPNKSINSKLPKQLAGSWPSLRKCNKCGKKMWENGKETHCICEFQEKTEEKENEAMVKTLKERVMDLYRSDFNIYTTTEGIGDAAEEIAARIGGTSATVVQSIIREEIGIKAKKPGYTAEGLQVIIDMYNAGCSDEKIGAEIGRAAGTISVKLSDMRKKGLIGLRTSHKKPIGTVAKKPEKKNMPQTGEPIPEGNSIPDTEKKEPKMNNEEIGNVRVWLNIMDDFTSRMEREQAERASRKPTLVQFIDFASRCGYELESAGLNTGYLMEITFVEKGE